jgi:high-affinity iron transporter
VTFGQTATWDLNWLVHKGTPVESLVTGVLGIPQKPALIEVIAYVGYLVPMLALVLIKPRAGAAPPAAGEPPTAQPERVSAATSLA